MLVQEELSAQYMIAVGGCVPGGSAVKTSLAVKETQLRSPSREDPLKKGMTAYSRILTWEEPGGLQSVGLQE